MIELTDIQKNILNKIIEGKSNFDIAFDLDYSESFIKKQIRILFKKFKVSKRVELVREALILKMCPQGYGKCAINGNVKSREDILSKRPPLRKRS